MGVCGWTGRREDGGCKILYNVCKFIWIFLVFPFLIVIVNILSFITKVSGLVISSNLSYR